MRNGCVRQCLSSVIGEAHRSQVSISGDVVALDDLASLRILLKQQLVSDGTGITSIANVE
jgi:hypothetical protein